MPNSNHLILLFISICGTVSGERIEINRPKRYLQRNYDDPNYNFEALPKSFDWRNVNGKNYLTVERNQHIPQYCGSCWAFASTSTIADRIFIQNNASMSPHPMLAVQTVIACAGAGDCGGGNEYPVFEYAKNVGIPHETCNLYQAKNEECNDINKCFDCSRKGGCHPVKNYTRYHIKDHGDIENKTEKIKAEIFHHGPVSCGMVVTSKFLHYTGGIAYLNGEKVIGGHAVEVIGWGKENGVEYWIGRNSWGTWWGENGGYFRVANSKSEPEPLIPEESCAYPIVDENSVQFVEQY